MPGTTPIAIAHTTGALVIDRSVLKANGLDIDPSEYHWGVQYTGLGSGNTFDVTKRPEGSDAYASHAATQAGDEWVRVSDGFFDALKVTLNGADAPSGMVRLKLWPSVWG